MNFILSIIKKLPFQNISLLFIIVFFLGLFYIVITFKISLYKYLGFIILLYFIIAIILLYLGNYFDRKLYDRPRITSTDENTVKMLTIYAKQNKPVKHLENKHITLLCENYNKSDFEEAIYIRCINKKNNIFFTITGNSELVSTVWLIFQREFNPNFTYNGLKFWYGECEFNFMNDIKLKEHKIVV